jgi:hypothetical protein
VVVAATTTLRVYRWISQVRKVKMDMWGLYRVRVRGGTMMWSEEEEEEEAWEWGKALRSIR